MNDDYGIDETYEDGDGYGDGAPQLTPEQLDQLAEQFARQAPQQQPAFDAIAQAHADHILEAAPDLRDPNSYAAGEFMRIVSERAQQNGVPELAHNIAFQRATFDSLGENALKTPAEQRVDAIFGGGRLGSKALPF